MATVSPCCIRTSVSCLNPTVTLWPAWWSICRSNFHFITAELRNPFCSVLTVFCSHYLPFIRQDMCKKILVSHRYFFLTFSKVWDMSEQACYNLLHHCGKCGSTFSVVKTVCNIPPLSFPRVSQSVETKMDVNNLARVFGPTLVGHAVPDPDPMTILHDTNRQPRVKWWTPLT